MCLFIVYDFSHCFCKWNISNVLYTYSAYTTQTKLKEHFDIMIVIERYPLKRCQGCVKLIASKVNCFLNITDLSEVQLCMSSNSWTWECPHTKDGADHVPLIFLSSVFCIFNISFLLSYEVGDMIKTLNTTNLMRDSSHVPLSFLSSV